MNQTNLMPSSFVLFQNPLMMNKWRPTIVLDTPDGHDRQLVVSLSSQRFDYSYQEYFPKNEDTRLRYKSCLALHSYMYVSSKTLRRCPFLHSWNTPSTSPYWDQVLYEWDQFVSDGDKDDESRYIHPSNPRQKTMFWRRHRKLMSIPDSIRTSDQLTEDMLKSFQLS